MLTLATAIRNGLRWLAIISVIPITVLAFVVAVQVAIFLSLSPLIRDIAHDPQDPPKTKAFDARVKATFQDGMKEDVLVQKLKAMGFSDPEANRWGRFAETSSNAPKCRLQWIVYWDTRPSGEAANISGKVTCLGREAGA